MPTDDTAHLQRALDGLLTVHIRRLGSLDEQDQIPELPHQAFDEALRRSLKHTTARRVFRDALADVREEGGNLLGLDKILLLEQATNAVAVSAAETAWALAMTALGDEEETT